LNPIQIGKDLAIDALVKRYLPQAATVLAWATGPIATAVQAFLDAQEVATDFDELRIMDDAIHRRIRTLVEPHMRSDWNDILTRAVQQAGPQLKPR
jgi:hypothetical protein